MIEFFPALLGAAAYVGTLYNTSFIRDDWYFIANNPLLHSSAGLLKIWTMGYVQIISGSAAGVFEYRPLTLLSFYLDSILYGPSPGLMHLTNIALHALNCILLLKLLRHFIPTEAAWIAACIFAIMPIHTEAVAGLVNRTELLVMLWTLSAWLLLDGPPTPRNLLLGRPPQFRGGFRTRKHLRVQLSRMMFPGRGRQLILGTSAYALGLLSKEHALLFPALLAMSDWTFRGRKPWDPQRRGVYAWLSVCATLYLAGRAWILRHPFQVGASYFARIGLLDRLLTVSRFWISRYAWSSLTGLGLCNDFSRPLIADSGPGDLFAWLCLLALLTSVSLSTWKLTARRSKTAFWVLLPFLFLLPSAHLLFSFDTLGAQRFFYLPSISVAVGLGWFFHVFRENRRRIGSVLCALYVGINLLMTIRRSEVWANDLLYYQDAVRLNPVSPGARVGYAMALLNGGDSEGAVREFHEALRIAPAYSAPYYNLGKIAWENGNLPEAEKLFARAHALNPQDASTLDFMGLLSEKKGNRSQAEIFYQSALHIQQNDSVALFNLGRLLWERREYRECRGYWNRFLELFPDDPEAPRLRSLLSGQKNGNPIGIK